MRSGSTSKSATTPSTRSGPAPTPAPRLTSNAPSPPAPRSGASASTRTSPPPAFARSSARPTLVRRQHHLERAVLALVEQRVGFGASAQWQAVADVAFGLKPAGADQREQRGQLLRHRAGAGAEGQARGEGALERERVAPRLLHPDHRDRSAPPHQPQREVDGRLAADRLDHAA